MLLKMFKELIFLGPSLIQPLVECLRIANGNVFYSVSSPVHVSWWRFSTLNIQRLQAIYLLAVFPFPMDGQMSRAELRRENLRDLLIRNGTVVYPVDSTCEPLQAILQATRPRNQNVLEIVNSHFLCPLLANPTSCYRHVGALREDQEPHLRAGGRVRQMTDAVLEALLVCLPAARQEDP